VTRQHRPNVLVVDDDAMLCELLRATLELRGIDMYEAGHVIEAEQRLAAGLPDAIVLDVGLPGVDGLFYCERLRESPRTRAVPIVVISGSREAGVRALAVGAQGFLAKPFDPLQLLALLERVLGLDPLEQSLLEGPPGAAAAPSTLGELRRLLAIGRRQHELLEQSYRETVTALVSALESRDVGTGAHSQRVTAYATRLTMEFSPSLIDDTSLEWGFLLHDVGKIGVPDRILHKRSELTPSERRMMEQHTKIGESLLAHLPLLQGEGLNVVRSHHERWDGGGYPDGLAGTSIPVGARIFTVADTLDAMTHDRPYRKRLRWDDALAEIEQHAGTKFDPSVVDSLVACEPDLRSVHETTLAHAAAV